MANSKRALRAFAMQRARARSSKTTARRRISEQFRSRSRPTVESATTRRNFREIVRRLQRIMLEQDAMRPFAEHVRDESNWKRATQFERRLKWHNFAEVQRIVERLQGQRVDDGGAPLRVVSGPWMGPLAGISKEDFECVERNIQRVFPAHVRAHLLYIRMYDGFCGTEARDVHLDTTFGHITDENGLYICTHWVNSDEASCGVQFVKESPTINLSRVSEDVVDEVHERIERHLNEHVSDLQFYTLPPLTWTNLANYAFHRGPSAEGLVEGQRRFFFIVKVDTHVPHTWS